MSEPRVYVSVHLQYSEWNPNVHVHDNVLIVFDMGQVSDVFLTADQARMLAGQLLVVANSVPLPAVTEPEPDPAPDEPLEPF